MAGQGHRPKIVRQKSSEVRVPITIWRKSWARMGPSRPIAPVLWDVRGREEVQLEVNLPDVCIFYPLSCFKSGAMFSVHILKLTRVVQISVITVTKSSFPVCAKTFKTISSA
jgi:hypothetical protein